MWSQDTLWLVLRTESQEAGGDVLAVKVGEDTSTIPVAATPFSEVAPALSPNGRFLAYASNESGVSQVYVVPFPNTGDQRVQVSIERGIEPVWRRDGRELFYRRGSGGDLVAVEVDTEGPLQVGEESVLFPAGGYRAYSYHPQYDVAPDGRRFVMLRPLQSSGSASGPQMIQVQNWFTELEERLGGGR